MVKRKGLGKGTGKGYKNIIAPDPKVHSDSARGMKQKSMMNPIPKIQKQIEIPFASEVKFYANPKTRKIVWVDSDYQGKGWYRVIISNQVHKTRNPYSLIKDILITDFPGYKEVSLFSETSFHSSIGQDTVGKITNYGTEDYTLGYSEYTPIGKYDLHNPVKIEHKNRFAKIVNELDLQEWKYAVLNWIPEEDGIKLQIKVTTSSPSGDEKRLYQSKKYDMSDKKQAITDFKYVVKKIKKGDL